MRLNAADPNPFRYCGEYYDNETGFIYLRARYYDPSVGRFISKDPHWNVGNMIYGDNPAKDNPKPDTNAIKQSGNLYAYCMDNPVNYVDRTGNIAIVDDLILCLYAITAVCAATIAVKTAIPLIEDISEAIPSTWDRPASPFDLKIVKPKVKEKTEVEVIDDTITTSPPPAITYYHVTTKENALLIMASGIMKGGIFESGYVFAWRLKPDNYAITHSGAHLGVVISFTTYACFVNDLGITDPKVKKYGPVVSARPGPIKVENVIILT